MTAPDRAQVLAAWRRVLDIVEAHPDLPLPYLRPTGIYWYVTAESRPAQALAAIEAVLPCEMTGTASGDKYLLSGELDGLPVVIEAFASDVAEQRVTGTEVIETREWVRKPVEPQDAAEGDQS